MVLQHQLVLESGVLNKGEYISSIKCPSQMYAGEELKIERSEDSITVSSARNPREVFTEIKVANRSSRYESISKPKHILDRTLVEDDATLRELVDQNKTPHREKWIRHFLKGIPVSIDKLQLPISSSIIEFL